MKLFSRLNRRVGIDLGSSRTRIWVDQEGLVLDEPSLIAVDQKDQRVLAVGQEAKDMMGRVESYVKVFSPVSVPKLEDDELVKALLKVLLKKVSQKVYFFSPMMVVSLPTNTYPVMRDVLVKVLTDLGASEVLIVDQPLAAAIGAGVPIADAFGSFVLQMGEGVVEAAGLSLGKTVHTLSTNRAGLDMSQELVYWFRQQKKLKISRNIAEQVKHNLGNFSPEAQYKLSVTGSKLKDGSPQEIEVEVQEIRQVFNQYGEIYVDLVKKLLATVSPDLTVDVIDKGLLISGGLAQLSGLEAYLVEQLGIPVSLVDEPDLAVIRGVGVILEHSDEFKQSLAYNN